MTEQQLRDAVEEEFVREVVRRVCERLTTLQKRALVVCTGSRLAFPVWSDALHELEQSGFRLDLFYSGSAKQVLDIDALTKKVHFEQIRQDDGESRPEQLAREYSTVIVPALTINTAAKLVACTPDTPAARIIFTSMMQGKNVVIAVDGCCPDNPDRAALGYRLTAPLAEQLRGNIKRMKDFGAMLATAQTLAQRVRLATGSLKVSEDKPARQLDAYRCSDRIIGRNVVAGLPQGAVLRVSRGSRLTQLAEDIVRARGITLEIDESRERSEG